MTDEGRRALLEMGLFGGAMAAIDGIGSGITGALGERVVNVTEGLLGTEQREINDLLNAFFGPNLPEISVGTYNQMRAFEGKSKKPSKFIMNSASRLICGLRKAHPEVEMRMCGDFELKQYTELTDAVVLGGPISNPDLANLLGYENTLEDRLNKGVMLPKANPQTFRLRWEQVHGETTVGEFDGAIRKAVRCDGGKQVERAQYAIRDHKNDKLVFCETEQGSNYLKTEFLQVVQLERLTEYKQTFIWGLHGHSLMGFIGEEDELEKGLNALLSKVEGIRNYQALIPVYLEHFEINGYYETRAFADWERIKVHPLERML